MFPKWTISFRGREKKSLVDCNGLMRQRVYVCNWMENVNILSCGIILYPGGLFALQPLACRRHRRPQAVKTKPLAQERPGNGQGKAWISSAAQPPPPQAKKTFKLRGKEDGWDGAVGSEISTGDVGPAWLFGDF